MIPSQPTLVKGSGRSKLRVLVLEDEYLIAQMIEDLLAEAGCQVVGTAARLADALALADPRRVDLVLLDVNIGGEMAFPLVERLERSGIPLVFLTGYGRSILPEAHAGHPVVSKPFSAQQLLQAIRQATEKNGGAT
jgi:DNA-binding response OmpR family regulator